MSPRFGTCPCSWVQHACSELDLSHGPAGPRTHVHGDTEATRTLHCSKPSVQHVDDEGVHGNSRSSMAA